MGEIHLNKHPPCKKNIMKNKRGQHPWNTAKFAGGKLFGIAKMILKHRSVYDLIVQCMAAHKLVHKLIYQQLKPELKNEIIMLVKELSTHEKLNAQQREFVESISEIIPVCSVRKLVRLHFRLTELKKELGV